MTAREFYCGIGKIPKGRREGTAKECLNDKQVRYWGIEAIPPDVWLDKQDDKQVLQKEQIKLKKLEDDAKRLVKDAKKIKLEIENAKTPAKKKAADKKMQALLKRRDNLVKRLRTQKKYVTNLEKRE